MNTQKHIDLIAAYLDGSITHEQREKLNRLIEEGAIDPIEIKEKGSSKAAFHIAALRYAGHDIPRAGRLEVVPQPESELPTIAHVDVHTLHRKVVGKSGITDILTGIGNVVATGRRIFI